MKNVKHQILGFCLAVALFCGVACFKTTEQHRGAVFPNTDVVLVKGQGAVPADQVEQGTYAVNQFYRAGTPIDPGQLFAAYQVPDTFESSQQAETAIASVLQQAANDVGADAYQSNQTFDVEIDNFRRWQAVAQNAAQVSGVPWAEMIIGTLFGGVAIQREYKRRKETQRADDNWTLAEATGAGINLLRDQLDAVPEEYQPIAREFDDTLKNTLTQMHAAYNVGPQAKQLVQMVKTPTIAPAVKKQTFEAIKAVPAVTKAA
ncbi:MAG: hypothetical protein AAF636_11535 [Pseudomonadota bacterium]